MTPTSYPHRSLALSNARYEPGPASDAWLALANLAPGEGIRLQGAVYTVVSNTPQSMRIRIKGTDGGEKTLTLSPFGSGTWTLVREVETLLLLACYEHGPLAFGFSHLPNDPGDLPKALRRDPAFGN